MKNTLTNKLLALAFLTITGNLCAQNVPIDFETSGNGASWTWTVFENTTNPPLLIIDNPDKSGINTSCKVAQFTALQSGNPWAGCESSHGSGLGSFMLDTNTSTIKIMVWKSVISDVGIKLVTPTAAALPEIKIPNTLTNQWELITFDFSGYIGQGPYATEMVDQVVIFPDFNLAGRTQDNICYFDNVWGVDSVTQACSGVSITESEKMSFNFYPNPTTDAITIESESVIDGISIYDLKGAVVATEKTSSKVVSIDVNELISGVYFVEAKMNDQLVRKKLIKE